tara:strand:- start:998 stop:1183 length:186 start_codon:yes stop_codon:yes gene_type:complete
MNKLKKKSWKDVENLCKQNNISPQDALTIVICEKTKEVELKWAKQLGIAEAYLKKEKQERK